MPLIRLAHLTRWVTRAVQLVIFVTAAVVAFLLRFDFSVPTRYLPHLLAGLCVWVPVKILVFHILRLDRGWWRYASIRDIARLAAANFAASVFAYFALPWFASAGFPRSIYFLDFLVCFGMTAGARLAVRLAFEFSRLPSLGTNKRTLIYGAGDAGVTLLRETQRNPALSYEIVGFIDDDPAKAGSFIQRVKVFGNGAVLPSIVASQSIETVLIALPSATGAQMTVVLRHCHEAGVSYKTIPGLAEVIEANGLATQIRPVALEDLLGRTPVHLEQDRISAKYHNRVALVTGAAGSIGSELCRLIARFSPASIVGYDNAETPLFQLERDMALAFPDVRFYPAIGSIKNSQRLAEVFGQYQPSIVYHAAAYKHVPMMESHVFEAVENNVFGTLNVAMAASLHGVEDFVMISSDKAVQPTNVMGATKRFAELVVRSIQNGGGRFVSVRFGNVLGSSGSVVPIFKEQIARGGPVTVTHPEMRRFFMTVPEACQLVLQASTMGSGGEIFVLDMGDPVRIADLARDLILLSGLRPEEDIKIVYTGVRPGEKLYEELSLYEEGTLPTCHEKIKVFSGTTIAWPDMDKHLTTVRRLCASRELNETILTLKEIIPDYNPSTALLRRVLNHSASFAPPG